MEKFVLKKEMSQKNNQQTADSFIELLEVLRRLRAPEGCPWDQEQTAESLIPYLLEETYEIIEAIEEGDAETLKEELGDLTLHILFQAELAREAGNFEIGDSLKHISEKLIHRHPHVFDKQNGNVEGDLNMSWEKAKQKEKKRKNLLDGVPTGWCAQKNAGAYPRQTNSGKSCQCGF